MALSGSSFREEYKIYSAISRGRGGTMILGALQISSNKRAALKVVPINTLEERKEAKKEIRIVTTIPPHNNLVEILGTYVGLNEAIIAMQMYNGDLLDHINTKGPLTEAEARPIFRQIAEGLLHCYKHGFSHGDVKLDNILLHRNPETNEIVCKLTDFGFANDYTPGEKSANGKGSDFYAAPEVWLSGNYDAEKADVWSLGVCLYAMLAGEFPFSSDNDEDLQRIISHGDYEVLPEWNMQLRVFLANLMHMKPSARPTLNRIVDSFWLD